MATTTRKLFSTFRSIPQFLTARSPRNSAPGRVAAVITQPRKWLANAACSVQQRSRCSHCQGSRNSALSAPTRLILLTGAPAAGKKTATSLITQITGISNIVEMSDLLKASKPKCDLNSTAALAPDSDACREFRKAVAMPSALPNSPGITVDGFPRSKTQVDCVRRYLQQLGSQSETVRVLMLHLAVNKPTSIHRQLFRGRRALENNEPVRKTDLDPKLAAQRYDVYEESKEVLLALSDVMPVVNVDASGQINEVRHQVGTALSTYEREWKLQEPCEDDPGDFSSFA